MWERRMAGDRRPAALDFWEQFAGALEQARLALAWGAGASYILFSQGWFGFHSCDPRRAMDSALHPELQPFGWEGALRGALDSVGGAARRLVEEIVRQVHQAGDGATLDRVAGPLLRRSSRHSSPHLTRPPRIIISFCC